MNAQASAQFAAMPFFMMIVIGAVIFLVIALALRNSAAARGGGVAAAALAVGVLAFGWLMFRGQHTVVTPVAAYQSPYDVGGYAHEGYVESPRLDKSWGLILVLGGLVAAIVFAIRSASPQARSAMLAGGIAVALLAVVLLGYTSVHEHRVAMIAEVPPVMAPASPVPHSGDAQTQPSTRKSSSGKASKSKNNSRSNPPVSDARTATQPQAITTTTVSTLAVKKPTPPEPADDEIAASSPKSTEHSLTPPPEAKPAPAPAEIASTSTSPLIELDTKTAKSDDRPAWVDSKGDFALDGTYYAVVHTNPMLNVRDAVRQVEPLMRKEAQEFVDLVMPRTRYTRLHHLLPWHTIVRQAEQDRYVETLHSRFAGADTVVVHVRMAFTPQLQNEVQSMMRQMLRYQRTGLLVLVGGFVLLVIGVIFAYLRIDTATKGYYTWRLRALALMLVLLAFSGLCGIIDEFDLDDAVETIDWQPVAQAPTGRLR
jgi:hypothetical protein